MKKNIWLMICSLLPLAGCCTNHCKVARAPLTGQITQRSGDEIVVCGQLIHTGAPVVTWMDPGGYDAYRTERRFAPYDVSSFNDTKAQLPKDFSQPNRYGLRFGSPSRSAEAEAIRGGPQLTAEEINEVRGGGWTLPMLQSKVDQFVLHYDVAGISRNCFRTLHDSRDLSVHFMLDLDGTIYQTLDLKERAWHATTSNDRSIGIEIANIGAYGAGGEGKNNVLEQWYRKGPDGHTRIVIGPAYGGGKWIRTPNFVGHPDRDEPIVGEVQGHMLRQYDLTPQQYDSLIKLTATLCMTFPKIKCDYPKDAEGHLITRKLDDKQLAAYEGVLGHYHIQTDKTDPGPALQWDKVIDGARKLIEKAKKHHLNAHWVEKPMPPESFKPAATQPTVASAAKSGS